MSEEGSSDSVAPSAPEVVEESDTTRELRERLRKHEKPSHLGLRTLVFVATLGAFIWFMRESGPVVIAVVVGVLAFHELGHLLAMKLLGYENMSIFFVPFMGAAVTGRARKPGGWRAAVVSLAGPLPGILLAASILAWGPAIPILRVMAVTLVYVNALNLLPFVPLDGGRLLNTILFSRHKYLELGGMVIGIIGLFAVPGLLPGIPAMWTGLFVGMLFHRSKMLEATSKLRGNHVFDGPTSALPEPSLWALNGAAHQVLEKTISTERNHTSTMAALHEESATTPARWHHSLGLFFVWAAALGVAWATWDGLKNPKANWQETVGPAALWSASYPATSKLTTDLRPAPGLSALHRVFSSSPLGEFGVTSFVLEDEQFRFEQNPGEADFRMRAMVTETEKETGFKVISQTSRESAGSPALQVVFQVPKGGQLNSLYIAAGNAVHVLTTIGASPEHELTFRQSFQVLQASPRP